MSIYDRENNSQSYENISHCQERERIAGMTGPVKIKVSCCECGSKLVRVILANGGVVVGCECGDNEPVWGVDMKQAIAEWEAYNLSMNEVYSEALPDDA